MNIAVFISGTGSNLKALIDAKANNGYKSDIKLVVSNKDVKGLFHAHNAKIDTLVSKDQGEILKKLREYNIELIVLAGFLPKVEDEILSEYENRIINIHPSLLPKYGGKGYHGMNVHKAVFENNEKESGATVHYVNNELDKGEIIIQEKVDISDCKSPTEIQEKVLEVEHKILKEAVKIVEDRK